MEQFWNYLQENGIISYLLENGEYLLRVVLAAVCGLLIGVERESRMKDAGVRTHLVVALSAALMMVVSKYGFFDVVTMLTDAGYAEAVKLDPSRVASGIVTGIGFIGTGIIFVRNNQAVSGLTTAAGLWATVGVGMALGSGLYFMGISVTLLVLLCQTVLHKNSFFIRNGTHLVVLTAENRPGIIAEIRDKITEKGAKILSFRTVCNAQQKVEIELGLRLPKKTTPIVFCAELQKDPDILSMEY